jgi:hypothetical protein
MLVTNVTHGAALAFMQRDLGDTDRMNIGALGVNALLYLGSQLLKGDSAGQSFEQSANVAANSAGPLIGV